MTDQEPTPPPVSATILREIGLFGGLDEATLEVLAAELPRMQAAIGESVVCEGDPASEMFVVVGGELEVVKRSPGGSDVRVAMLGPGDWFGEMAIVDVQPRSATVRCLAPTILLRMSAEHVDRLLYRQDLKAYSLLIMNIARELSRRLRVADGILSQFVGSVADQYMAPSQNAHRRSSPSSVAKRHGHHPPRRRPQPFGAPRSTAEGMSGMSSRSLSASRMMVAVSSMARVLTSMTIQPGFRLKMSSA